MSKEIYNEGRVVGYSSYELYVKHALSENPDIEPATEREWLAAQIGHGSSMILNIPVEQYPTDPVVHSIDFPLPQNSMLCAANTIVASQFFGECVFDSNTHWATRVIDYGQGISNLSSSYPETTNDAEDYPTQTIQKFSETEKKQILNYIKIQDAVVLQPGVWKNSENNPPEKDLIPNLNAYPILRITFVSQITTSFNILLTGFTNRSIISGISGIDTGSTAEEKPENGDFLGPELYPWANKVVFTYSGIAAYFLRSGLTSGNDFLNIENDEDSTITTFTISPLQPDVGISINGPHSPGGPVIIGSKIANKTTNSYNKYVKIEQSSSNGQDNPVVTYLTHSKIIPGSGLAINGPADFGSDANFSSIIKPWNTSDYQNNHMLKVEQSYNASVKEHNTNNPHVAQATTLNGVRTRLKVSKSVAVKGISITQPTADGNDVKFSVPISSQSLTVTQNTGSTTINLKAAGFYDSTGILKFKYANNRIELTWDYAKLAEKLLGNSTAKNNFLTTLGINKAVNGLSNLLKTIFGVNTSNPLDNNGKINWSSTPNPTSNSSYKIPWGNLNVYSTATSSNDRYIKTHATSAKGDLKVK